MNISPEATNIPQIAAGLSEAQRRVYDTGFFNSIFEQGHAFSDVCGRCDNCRAPIIDLTEDGHYGDIRPCVGQADYQTGGLGE